MYKVEILADSLSPQGNRLTTMKITFPRMVLAEMNTHRMFSRNSASSPEQKDHKGMQGTEYFTEHESNLHRQHWLTARDYAIHQSKILANNGEVTKQLCNRLLEPFMWHTVIITSGKEGLDNFFKLRCPEYTIDLDDLQSLK